MTGASHRRRRQALCLAVAGLCTVALVPQGAAATCTEEIARLAREYGLSGAPPSEAPSGSTDRGSGPQGTRLSETKRVKMEALLNAAKAAEQQRETSECFAHLSEARSIPEPG